MNYLSLFSGIEAATVAWRPLGWRAVAFAEIEPFPCAVLKHHYPDVPNLGDVSKITKATLDGLGPIDLVVGGSPCQSFSVAGLRKGLADPRGNLALEFLRVVEASCAQWVVWENVPGVLSSWTGPEPPRDLRVGQRWESTETSDIGCFLAALSELGYGWAYRSLDAQYHNLAQRRERVFVVGCLGDWRRAAAVLLERSCLSGNPAPSRAAGQRASGMLAARTKGGGGLGTDLDLDGGCVAGTLSPGAHPGGFNGQDAYSGHLICPEISPALKSRDSKGPSSDGDGDGAPLIAHALRATGFDASEDGTGRGTPIVPVAFSSKDHGGDAMVDVSPTLRAMGHADSHANGGGQVAVASVGVRRLMPIECERLQGFPDNWTLVPFRGKPATDGPRYKTIGNSMAVPVVRWLGRRIEAVMGIGAAQ